MAISQDDLYRLKRADHAMIRWICGVKRMQPHSTSDLRSKLFIPDLEDLLRYIVGAIFEQGGKKLEATKFLLIWLLYDPNGQDPKGF